MADEEGWGDAIAGRVPWSHAYFQEPCTQLLAEDAVLPNGLKQGEALQDEGMVVAVPEACLKSGMLGYVRVDPTGNAIG